MAIVKYPGNSFSEKIRGAFSPKKDWGPIDPVMKDIYKKEVEFDETTKQTGAWNYVKRNLAD